MRWRELDTKASTANWIIRLWVRHTVKIQYVGYLEHITFANHVTISSICCCLSVWIRCIITHTQFRVLYTIIIVCSVPGCLWTSYSSRADSRLAPSPWWRPQIETFSALLAICAGNSPVTGEFLAQRPVSRSFDVFFDLRLNRRLSKQSWGWWFETLSRPLWRHCNAMIDVVTKYGRFLLAQRKPRIGPEQ